MGRRATVWRVLRWSVIVVLVAANLAAFYALRKTESVQAAVEETFETVPEVEAVLDEPPPPEVVEAPITILVLGSDSRENLPPELLEEFGDFAGARADVIMLVELIRSDGSMRVLSIPRDLRVEIPGQGTDKINAAFAYGGAPLMVETVRQVVGMPIHHYVEIDFVGFAGLVDELGGVTIDFPYPARDLKSGLSVEAGTQVLDGQTALAYARSRSYQELRDGRWTSVEATDIGRTGRQQELVLAILDALKRPSVVLEADKVVRRLEGYANVDPAFLDMDFVDLGLTFRGLSSQKIARATLPTDSVRIDGIWYEVLREPDASEMLAEYRSGVVAAPPTSASPPTTAASIAPAELSVAVLNGNGLRGAAGVVADELDAMGFDVVEVADADSFSYHQTTVRARSAEAAELVVSALGYGVVDGAPPPEGVDVVVIVGADS